MLQLKTIFTIGMLAGVVTLAGCATAPPKNAEDLCAIFQEKPQWRTAALAMQNKWGVPIPVPFAMMYQESSYRHDAKPPKNYLLWFIPWGRVSSAYGYAQAKDEVWGDYERETGQSASRDSFEDALDFMGWYMSKAQVLNGTSKWDAYGQYLNYHEGWSGYRNQSYQAKAWLMRTAEIVRERAARYTTQYNQCRAQLM
ncbi:hypothetical protein EV681_1940 [Advenella incenata]|uniref:Transglycosylase SLT domain-containing protein n=1 Tax=Advenella incenata TaxID=267800 RepID=A0A4Q7VU29_9BURK|nr:hypothetical protein [Advenella incenata]RZU00132.1 hypothetical protein EV681_1940 [Advenella incenata]